MDDFSYIAIARQAQQHLQELPAIPDISSFILKNPMKWPMPWLRILADQWHFQKKATQKLGPWWEKYPNLIGPPKLSWEQASSYQTASWKTQLIEPQSTVVDMTGGWGMDALFFSLAGAHVTHCEVQTDLSDIVTENARLVNTPLQTFRGSGFDYLVQSTAPIDLIYLDPARRDANQKKVVRLSDLTPDLTPHWPTLWTKTSRILIKLSPMMDLNELAAQIPGLARVILLSVRNELKEILAEAHVNFTGKIRWEAIEIPADEKPISFHFEPEKENPAVTSYAEPRLYLYEPFVGILKLGAFHQIAADWNMEKLHPNSHLYTSDNFYSDFPGRVFRVIDSFKAKPDDVQKQLGKPIPTNILVRNFGENGEALAQKWQIKPVDKTQFLIFTQTISHKKRVLYAHRLK